MDPQQRINVLTIAVIVLLIAFIVATSVAVLQTLQVLKIRSTGKIKGIGVEIYADEGRMFPVEEIDWGMLEPGEVKNTTIWVINVGNVPSNISMWTDAWTPANASDYIFLTWDYNGTMLEPNFGGEVVVAPLPIVLTLTVDANISGIWEFSFDIWISVEG